ncbi:MAG: DEAD/DEAH box helicase [Burkholderiales bacterium]
MSLSPFHPAVARWFAQAFPQPTAPQAEAWPAIRAGRHALIAAPTGSGKTLAAFLAAIDELVRQGVDGRLTDETQVVYVSPLKALSNDIERNLQWPLAGIREQLKILGLPDVDIRVLVRTGDTPPSERQAMRKRPPHILVTTPESLYLLLTSDSGRGMLASARSVIVDEIHAVAGSKRGSHLALSLERLTTLAMPRALTRIGLSATQKPIEEVAQFLVGADALDAGGKPACAIIDSGHVRQRDLALELPGAPLEAVMSGETWEQVYDRLAELIHAHRTTLVFANTRRQVERVTRHLSERLGRENVAAHHGSLSKEQRLDAEQRLKAGKLRALVATASLELGIDIGEVDLACQLGSPRSIATFLQRVGRSGHAVGGTPKGRLFPGSRDDLVECAALLDAVRRGELDRLIIPQKPLDVLAQQIVAEVANREYGEDELFNMVRRAYPYRALAREEFDAVVRVLSDGYATRRGRRSAYLHRDAVNRRLRGRKGARLTALTCGGAIPDNADYRVILEPTGTFIGTLNEDFAVESMTGDIFQLGNASYRILKIESGQVRVEDAKGMPPTIPFWIGEAPARTDELSQAVSRLRAALNERLAHITGDSLAAVTEWLMQSLSLDHAAARQLTEYLAAAKGMLGVLPTQDTLVIERFFDETGGMQLIVHSPFGNRINRAWGLSLRKRFCRKFNFELQAAVTEDAIVLSLGETHSFPLEEVAHYLNSKTVRAVLIQALLAAPLFTTRWRWVATISLAIKRFHGGRKNPPPLQRIQAEDLIAVVFPDQIACAENIAGDREVPDHPLVNQTIADCLTEAMDIDGLTRLLVALERGEKQLVTRDLPHPSPLAQEILNARPYGFLDDAPLEERRTQAVMSRRWLDPVEAADFGKLDAAAIGRVRDEAWPAADNPDELHDALMLLGALPRAAGERSGWEDYFRALVAARRATCLHIAHGPKLWVAVEHLPRLRAVYPDAVPEPALAAPAEFAARAWTAEEALTELVRGQLQGLGPVTAAQLAQQLGVTPGAVDMALAALEGEGFALRGQFTPRQNEDVNLLSRSLRGEAETGEGPLDLLPAERARTTYMRPGLEESEGDLPPLIPAPSPPGEEGSEPWRASRAPHILEWCERRLLARIHRYTIERLRAEIEPVSAADFLRFLFRWHGLGAEPLPEGPQALAAVVEQLEGFEASAGAWEADILPARTHNYDPEWLDGLCLSGRVLWARLTPPKPVAGKDRTNSGPVRTTPIALLTRRHNALWRELLARRPADAPRLSPRAQSVADYLRAHGASFFDDIVGGTGLLKAQAEEALGELVAAGLIHADSYAGLRALLLPADRRGGMKGLRRRRMAESGIAEAGRWTLLQREPKTAGRPDPEIVEHVARLLLKRYGVVFKRVLEREAGWLPPWYELLTVYRRLEARGEIRGGRFVAGFPGEQYALPEALSALRALRREQADGALVSVSAADPLNLVGVLTPGARVPAPAGNRVLYRDGVPIAVHVAGESRFLADLEAGAEWEARNALRRRPMPPALRGYLH